MKGKKFVTKTGAILYLAFACLSWYFGEMSVLQVMEVFGQVVVVFGIARKFDRQQDHYDKIDKNELDNLISSNTE